MDVHRFNRSEQWWLTHKQDSEIIWKDHIQQSRTGKEIKGLTEKVQQKGLTLVLLRLYFNDRGRVKLEIARATKDSRS